MELSRLLRVVRERWIFVIALGVIGAASGWGLTVLSNQDIDPRFQAIAPVRLVPEAGETIADLADDLETELEVATLATRDVVSSQPGSGPAAGDPAGTQTTSAGQPATNSPGQPAPTPGGQVTTTTPAGGSATTSPSGDGSATTAPTAGTPGTGTAPQPGATTTTAPGSVPGPYPGVNCREVNDPDKGTYYQCGG